MENSKSDLPRIVDQPILSGANQIESVSSLFSGKKDYEIWKEFKRGNRAALIYIYNTHINELYSYANQFTRDKALIKDAVQDVFVRLFEKSKNLSDTDSIKFYLYKSIKREVTYLIKKARKSEDRLLTHKGLDFEYESSIEEILIDRQIKEQNIKRIRKAANNLHKRQREIIFYHFFEGFSIKQIKELMNFNSLQATHNLLNRALIQLKTIYAISLMIMTHVHF